MARNKSSLRIKVEYYPVRLACAALKALPPALAEAVLRQSFQIGIALSRRRSNILRNNIAAAFPEKTLLERETIIRDMLGYFARSIVFLIHLKNGQPGGGYSMRFEGKEHFAAAQAHQRGVIAVASHLGCWEALVIEVAKYFPKVAAIGRPLDNPMLSAFVSSIRSQTGGTMISHRQALKECLRHLRHQGSVGILMDQNFALGGYYVRFFNRLASTTPLVPILVQRTGAVIVPMYAIWQDRCLRVIAEPPIENLSKEEGDAALIHDTQRLTSIIEGWIRQYPSQWLWLHNRWKRQPQPDEKPVVIDAFSPQ